MSRPSRRYSKDYMCLSEAGYVPKSLVNVVEAHEDAMSRNEYNPHSRAFDVTLHNGPWDRFVNVVHTVVANSFEDASRIAVIRANAQLSAWKASAFLYQDPEEELPRFVPFTKENVLKIEVVRSQVTVGGDPENLFNQ